MFGRATVRLGIGPHSSNILFHQNAYFTLMLTKKLQLQLLVDFVPQTPYHGCAPGFRCRGTSVSHTRCYVPQAWRQIDTTVVGTDYPCARAPVHIAVNTARRVTRPINTGSVHLAPVSRIHGPCWPKHFHVSCQYGTCTRVKPTGPCHFGHP